MILSGKPLQEQIKEQLKRHTSGVPGLAIIQIGSVEASRIYVKAKKKFGEEIGVSVVVYEFPDEVSEEEVVHLIQQLNADTKVGGIIVQLPIPAHLSKSRIIETIDPEKDVDGLHSVNVKKLMTSDPTGIVPATTRGILSLLAHYNISYEGKQVLVVGRSDLVGKPTALALLNRQATVTIAHSKTQNLKRLCTEADIIVSAVGVPGLITADHVRAGQVLIDVGITRKDGVVVGDVSKEAQSLAQAFSPVPGGVGLLTIASLFQNLLRKYTGGITT